MKPSYPTLSLGLNREINRYQSLSLKNLPLKNFLLHMAELAEKTAFVTVGATAPFPALIEACLKPEFLATLVTHGYTELRIQHGLVPENWGGTPAGRHLLGQIQQAISRTSLTKDLNTISVDSTTPSSPRSPSLGSNNDTAVSAGTASKTVNGVRLHAFAFVESIRDEIAGANLVISHAGTDSHGSCACCRLVVRLHSDRRSDADGDR